MFIKKLKEIIVSDMILENNYNYYWLRSHNKSDSNHSINQGSPSLFVFSL